jgi:hypothetical protein
MINTHYTCYKGVGIVVSKEGERYEYTATRETKFHTIRIRGLDFKTEAEAEAAARAAIDELNINLAAS